VANLKTAVHQFVKVITRTQDIPRSKDGRHIDLNVSKKDDPTDERTGKAHIGNTITSSRYTLYNFLPRQLLFQFSRVSNFYFLCIAVLQLTGFSTTGTYSTLVPLMAFVSIAMAKEGFDDYRRHLLDQVENRNTVEVLRAGDMNPNDCIEETASSEAGEGTDWTEVKWSAVKVGDIVKLKRNDAVPADLVILYSDGPNGMAYIGTAALDGESNLKARQPSPILRKVCQNESDLAHCKAHIVVEDPNIDLYNFNGRITIGDETLPLTGNEVIYRGSVLRNTPHTFGMVINTGEECKIRMNATKNRKAKAPSMQHIVNQVVVIIATFVLILTGLNNAAYGIWQDKQEDKSWYLQNASVTHGELFASSFVMFSTMIPLALYISLEIVKVGQMYILGDIDMYDAESDTPMEPRTNTINEELGQITHVFSDKTGTLTENIMRFRKMSIAGTSWFHDFDLKERATAKSDLQKTKTAESALSGQGLMPRPSMASRRPSATVDALTSDSKSEPTTRDLVSYLQRKPDSPFARKAKFFLLAIALCHTALPEVQKDGEIDYQAMSPDELALVRAGKNLGVIVVDRPAQSITILTRGKDDSEKRETYEVLDVIEFSSKRKRMSTIIRFPNGKICLFCKGADSSIIKRLKTANEAIEKDTEIRKSMTSLRLSEAQEVLRRQSEDQGPRNSLTRNSFARSRSRPGRPSFVSRRSTGDGRTSIGDLGRIMLQPGYDSPRASMAASRRSSNYEIYHRSVANQYMTLDDSAVLDLTLQHVHDFATEGLRTLMYGYKYLGEDEYRTWKKLFREASTSLVNRQELIDQASESLEQGLDLAGATAIEDELQKGVPETIDKLRRAGMRLWMLTGDKRETAINIGHSCKLIKRYSEVIVLDHEKGNLEQTMTSSLFDIMHGDIAHSVVVIDGQTLSDIEANPTLANPFFELVIAANSVICCRASPTQKAFLVKTVRTKVKRSVTLAIGDSSNDIAMIQEAHVGIGISGKEGMQAARTSDYSIGQFRFLQKLLLVHGRWNYIRTAKYILGTFWYAYPSSHLD
jgi:phospholipid-translocating ATPase